MHIDIGMRQHDRSVIVHVTAGGRVFCSGGVDRGCIPIGGGERLGQLFIGPIVDIDETKIIVLAVGAAAFRMVVILKPMRPDDLRQCREITRRRRRALCPLGLGIDRHQMAVIHVAGAVLARREEPLGDQHRLAARQLFKPAKEIAREPAVAGIYIVVDRDRIDMRRHRLDRRRIVVDRQPVAKIERVGIGGADRALGERIIALGDDAGPFADRCDTMAVRPQRGELPGVEQSIP